MADLRKLKDRAAELVAKGKLEKAADAYREVIAADRRDVASRQKLADVLRRAGDAAGAVATYRDVADAYARDGLLLKAIAVCKIILEIDPAHGETQAMLAELYSNRGARGPARPPTRSLPAVAAPEDELPEAVVELPLEATPASVIIPEPPIEVTEGREIRARPPATLTVTETPFEEICAAAQEALEDANDDEITITEALDDEPLPPLEPTPNIALAPAPHAAAPVPVLPPRAAPAAPLGLPRIPLFSDLSPGAFVALAERIALRRVKRGEVILRERERGSSFFVVASGTVRVEKRDEAGTVVPLARLGEGTFFGEMALLTGEPRAATVVAETESELLEIAPEVLEDLCREHPHVASSLRRFYRQRLLANALATSPVFRPFDRDQKKAVVERFRSREVRIGERVIREGDASDGLYVILAGAVEIRKRRGAGEVLAGQLREGDVFGEMSCLRKGPASASVVVRRAGTLLRLPRHAFDELVVTYPQILEAVSELSEERAQNLEFIVSGQAEYTEEGLVLI